MPDFRHVGTFDGTGYADRVTDLRLLLLGQRLLLYSATRTGVGVWTVDAVDATPAAAGGWAMSPVQRVLADPQLVLLRQPDGWSMIAGGVRYGADAARALTAEGLRGEPDARLNAAPLPGDLLDAQAFDTAAGKHLLAVGRVGSTALSVWSQQPTGALTQVWTAPPAPGAPVDARLDAILPVRIGGATLIFTASIRGDFVAAHRVLPNGTLAAGEYVGLDRATGMDGPRHLVHAEVEGHHFLVVGSAGSSSLTTIRIMPGGEMVPVDHVIDERTTRFQASTAMQVVQVGGRTFVLAGGKDGGMTLFTLTPDGRLLHLSTVEDQDGQSLSGLSALAARVVGGRIVVMAGSEDERGISQYLIDPGTIGQTRHVGAGSYTGTAAGDLIQGGLGTVAIAGGAGDDILIAGSRAITLTGGAGDDVFVPLAVPGTTIISDFEPGHDRLDLSLLGMVRSIKQLQMRSFPDGIRIRFGETLVEVRSRDGRRLDRSLFTDAMFPVAHYTPPDVRTTLVGTSAGDVLIANRGGSRIHAGAGNDTVIGSLLEDVILGESGNDRLNGAGGDDTLAGGAGRDLVRGGAGDDSLSGGDDADMLLGEFGRDTLVGDAGNDILWGDEGDDVLFGGADNDWMSGGEGNDTLNGQGGRDTMVGGGGSDLLLDTMGDNLFRDLAGDNVMIGGDGRDRMFAGSGADRLESRGGDDSLFAGAGNDVLRAGAGNDIMLGESGNDTMLGEAGSDSLWGGDGADVLDGGSGNDRLAGGFGADRLDGGSGNDTLIGGEGDDLSRCGDGNDRAYAGGGNDRSFGGEGDDTLTGDDGSDLLAGEGGNDVLVGGSGDDTIDGGAGSDDLFGNTGDDVLVGGEGADRLRGGVGDDHLLGGAGNDTLNGQGGRDLVEGGDGDDLVIGLWDDDTLSGGAGNDSLVGGDGNDRLSGGAGADLLIGETGADVFVFAPGDEGGQDTVADFSPGEDLIDLSAYGLASFGAGPLTHHAGEARWTATGDGVVLRIDLQGDGVADLAVLLSHLRALHAGDVLL